MKTKKKFSLTSRRPSESNSEDLHWDLDEPTEKELSWSEIESTDTSTESSTTRKKGRFNLTLRKSQSSTESNTVTTDSESPPWKETPPKKSSSPNIPEMDGMVIGKKGKSRKRGITVSLKYTTSELNISGLIMESITSLRPMPNWTLKRWSEFLHYVGQLPVWVVAGTPHVWNQLVYAAELLRVQPPEAQAEIDEGRHSGLATRHPDAHAHREFKPGEVQIELGEQHSWGVDAIDPNKPAERLQIDTKPLDHSKPIREQMDERKAQKLEDDRAQAAPAAVELASEGPTLAWEAKWVKAEEYARGSRKAWEGKFDTDFEEMIRYCYAWLRDVGEVPQPYPMDEIELFWPRPTPTQLKMTPEAVKRRTFITGRVIKLWQKSLAQDGVMEQIQLKRQPLSYRVVLAAKKLATAIEWYVEPDPIHGEDDGELMDSVKKCAIRYFKAHFPITAEGVKPGPLDTLDPDYVGYLKLCRKYGLKEGTLLHKANL